MDNIKYGFILTTFSGLSTLIGTIIIFFKNKDSNKIINAALSFATGVMFTVSISDLIPEGITLLNNYFYKFPSVIISFIFVIVGIILSNFIDKYLPDKKIVNNKKLYRIGLISMLAIILHNIPEGIATFMASTNNAKLGLSLAIAISLHNIPEGISISVPIFYSTNSRRKAVFYTFISALSEPFGALITYLFLSKYINNLVLGCLFNIIAGIMIHISIYELFKESMEYKDKKITIFFIILGCIIMLTNHFLF